MKCLKIKNLIVIPAKARINSKSVCILQCAKMNLDCIILPSSFFGGYMFFHRYYVLIFDSKLKTPTIQIMKANIMLCTACDGKLSTIEWLFDCLKKQIKFPDVIILLVYVSQTKQQFNNFVSDVSKRYPILSSVLQIVSSHNSSHIPWIFHGYDRQFLVEYSSWIYNEQLIENISLPTKYGVLKWEDSIEKLTLMLDVDNEVEPSFIQSLYDEYQILRQQNKNKIILAPTVMRRRSWSVQSQWILWYSFLIPKYRFASFEAESSPQQVVMMGGNCLFGKTESFQKIWFDENFPHSYEDIDFTYRLTQSWIPLRVTASTVTYHMESEGSKLDQKRIGNSVSAYRRMRNYILFVRKNATVSQKIQAYGFSIWGLYVWFILNALMYWWEKRWELVIALSTGLKDGIMWK